VIEFNNVKIFTDNIEQEALNQLHSVVDTKVFEDSKIRVMPDVHTGKGSVIGFTANLTDKVIPNIVGVDIACGMLTVPLGKVDIDLTKLDKIIKKNIPCGREVCEKSDKYYKDSKFNIRDLRCYEELKNKDRLEASIGTLGGGNHFIEVDIDEDDCKYLVIHTGSRNLGKQVAEVYQHKAIRTLNRHRDERLDIINKLKSEGKEQEIEQALKQFDSIKPKMPDELCYVEGESLEDYLYDMRICQKFATINRETIAEKILVGLRLNKLKNYKYFHTLHNYIDVDTRIIRKGAISALQGQKVLIPLNMRDGSIIGIGKGNEDWNYSAPHGAGRIMSRSQARKRLTVEEFQNSMNGIYTTTANESTIDEAPMAYKPAQEIIELIKDTVEIEKIIKPIYNFKAAE
jgi:RNA-splicing ligase RtcB